MKRTGTVKVRLGRSHKVVVGGLSHTVCLGLCPQITDAERGAVLRLAGEGMSVMGIHLETGLSMPVVTGILDAAREGKPSRRRGGRDVGSD